MNKTTTSGGDPRVIPVGQEPPPMLTDAERVRHTTPGTPSTRTTMRESKNMRYTRDRFGVINAFIDCTMGILRRNEIAVWMILWRDTKGGTAQTSQEDIARRVGTTTRTVRRIIGRLRGYGLLVLVRRGGLNKGPSIYRVQPHRTETAVRCYQDKTVQ